MAITSQQKHILIIPFTLLLTIVANPLIKLSDSAGTTFDLIHRDQLPVNQNLTLAERVKQMLYRDMIRMQMIQTNCHNKQQQKQQNVGPTIVRRKILEAAVSPIRSGSSDGTGQYFVEMMVGTPANKFLLVVDTASGLTWFDCNYKGINQNPPKVVFDADHSTSFKTINCSSTICQNDLRPLSSRICPNDNSNCFYIYGYLSGDVEGIFGSETVTFNLTDGSTSAINEVVIGCTNSSESLDNFMAGANGIMGLGCTPFSILNQTSNLFGNTFSYCLVDMQSNKTTSSKLFLGSPSQGTPQINGTMQTTKLELSEYDPFYHVNILNISIGGKLLNIPAYAWDFKSGNGAIIDSGTTLANLVESAYGPVINALNKSMSSFTSKSGPKSGPFDLCYAEVGFNYNLVPELKIGFVGGATFVVPEKNYVTDVLDDGGENVKCMAFNNLGASGLNVIGNLLQQNNLWEFDIGKRVLSFGSSTCT